jgi:F420-dependent oxidoreductase-like protein
MRYGVMLDTSRPIDAVVEEVRGYAEEGFSSAWAPQVFAHDALTLLSVVGREVPGIELGTSVVPVYPRHPLTLAAQGLTTQQATAGRLALGIGLSHQVVVEGMWGYSFDKPARYMREYLAVLLPALRGEQVAFDGDVLKGATMGPLPIKADPPKVLLAALAPVMLKLAGEQTDGTITWVTGPHTIESHIAPRLSAAATAAGRPAPRIAAGLPVCVTNDPDSIRAQVAEGLVVYGQLPSYRAMLDREGAEGPADVAIVGDESTVAKELDRMADAGTTDFMAALVGNGDDRRRTRELLASR